MYTSIIIITVMIIYTRIPRSGHRCSQLFFARSFFLPPPIAVLAHTYLSSPPPFASSVPKSRSKSESEAGVKLTSCVCEHPRVKWAVDAAVVKKALVVDQVDGAVVQPRNFAITRGVWEPGFANVVCSISATTQRKHQDQNVDVE